VRPTAVLTRPTRRSAALLLAGAATAAALAGCSGGEDVTTVPGGPASGSASDSPTGVDGDTPVTSVPVPSTSGPTTKPAPPADGSPAQADLTVVVDDGAGGSSTWTLTCADGQAGGTLPTAADACAQLAAVGPQALAEPAADRMCTEIYGGPQTATITGTFAGSPVDVALSRTNGCEIGRWDELSALVGPAGGPDS
jgi:hypothetical protein